MNENKVIDWSSAVDEAISNGESLDALAEESRLMT